MIINNDTKFSTKLVKDIMRLAKVQRQDAVLLITHDCREDGKAGYFTSFTIGNETTHLIHIREEGDVLTLGHELRHLAQLQRLGLERYNAISSEILESDAELFELYLEERGY